VESAIRVANVVVYAALGLVAVRFALRHRTPAAAWAATTFAVLGATVVVTSVVPAVEPAAERWTPAAIYLDVVVLLLGVFPYLLHRFSRALRGRATLLDRLADAGLVAMAAWTLAAPPFPPEGADQPGWFQLYTMAFLVWWVALLGGVSVRLWRLGAGQPGIVRGRMRLMAVAALLMNLALLASVLASGAESLRPVTAILGWAAAAGFLLGMQPVAGLRTLWRARDEVALREAEVGLLTAADAESAAEAVVGAAAAVIGGAGARVEAADGRLLAHVGDVDGDGITVSGRRSTVTVAPSRLTPVLGHGEEALLRQLCTHLDLALGRLEALEESEAARTRAEQANIDLQHLVYGVSHDLRNPLVTITGFLQLLEREQDLTERSQMLVERMTASARYMQGLVDDLLQLSRVGHADVEREDVALGPVVRGVAEDLAMRYPELSVEVGSLPTVRMNAVRVRQVFANLLENAARYARPDGGAVSVRVSATTGDGWATVDVTDDGRGIPLDQRDRVFQIFQRLDGFDATSEGSGIGLTMCRRIVGDVGGSIHVADAVEGTTMRMTLPLAGRPAARPVRTPA
jgi:signal transduction histidine kinase